MVRLKQRYILFEILHPPTDIPPTSASNAFLAVHRESPSNINPKTISAAIRNTVDELYGDFGSGHLMALNIKYFNNKTSLGIIRCSRTNFHYVTGSFPMITKIDGIPIIFHSCHVSGTIRKCEDFAIARNRAMMTRLKYLDKLERGEIDVIRC